MRKRSNNNMSKAIGGFTLTELMVGLTVSSIVAIATVSAFSQQSGVIAQQTLLAQAQTDGRQAHELLTRLLRQAHRDSIVSQTLSDGKKEVTFTIPSGIAIWPNDASPFDKNSIRILWDNVNFTISVGNVIPGDAFAATDMLVLAGNTQGINTRITDFGLSGGTSSRTLSLTAQAGTSASTASPFQNIVLPRN